MIKLWGILKGLLVQETSDRTKQLSIEVNPSATTATRTTLEAAQTADVTVTLPDATDTLVGKATTDILTNKTIDGDLNTLQDIGISSLKQQLVDANSFIVRDVDGFVISDNVVPTSNVAGISDTQTLTNKTIDADLNTITNIDNADIKAAAAIDTTKIADGSVSNDEFQYINSLTSNAQTQINAKQALSEKGVANGYASLDGSGLVPVTQLPSYVDDVVEYANLAAFPVTGESGKIYVALDTNNVYRWGGSSYVQIAANGANQSLSNLTSPTALNQHLLPGVAHTYDIGAIANPMRFMFGKEAIFGSSGQRGTLSVVDTNGSTITKVLTAMVSPASSTSGVAGVTVEGADTVLISGTVDKKILVETKNNAAGNSGDISIQTGTATGTRGEIALKGRQVNVNSSKIVNVTDPTAAQDAATKAYVDTSGGGSGSKNYLNSDSADLDLGVGNWLTDNGAGSPATLLTVSQYTAAPLAGTGSLSVAKTSGDATGQYAKLASKTLDITDRGKQLFGSFAYDTTSANYVSDNFILEIYDNTNSIVVSSSSLTIPKGKGKFIYSVPTSSNTVSLTVRLKAVTTNSLTYTLYFDEFRLGPAAQINTVYRKSATLSLNNNFSAGTIQVERVGNIVTVAQIDTANHTSGAVASTSAGLLPDWARPTDTARNDFDFSGTQTFRTFVTADGAFNINYSSGVRTSCSGATISYTVPDIAGPVLNDNELNIETVSVIASQNSGTHSTSNTFQGPVLFTVETEDSHSAYNPATGLFTAPKAGEYLVSAAIGFTASSTGTRFSAVYVNGVFNSYLGQQPGQSGSATLTSGAVAVKVNKDDTIGIWGYQNSGGALAYSTLPGFAFLTIKSLPDYTIIGASSDRQYFVSDIKDIPTALVWNSTTPAGTVVKKYKWIQDGKKVDLFFWFDYSGTGTSNQFVYFNTPSDLPTPSLITANSLIATHIGAGGIGNGGSVQSPCAAQFLSDNTRVYLNSAAALTANEGHGHITYFID